jgi:hypothetical protein
MLAGRDDATVGLTAPIATVRAGFVCATVVLAAAALSLALLASAYGVGVRPVGPDTFSYMWRTRIVGVAPLAEVGTRPGVPVLGAWLAGTGVASRGNIVLILGLVLNVTLGLAVAGALRRAFRLPIWMIVVTAAVVSTWGGTIQLSAGYLANGFGLVCMVVALVLAALPGPTGRTRILGIAAAALASGLTHPGFLPLYAVFGLAWGASSAWSLHRRGARVHVWSREPAAEFLVALGIASIVAITTIFGVMQLHLSDVTNLDDGIDLRNFGQRLLQTPGIIGLGSGLPVLALVGWLVARRLRQREARPLLLLSASAAGVCLLGVGMTLVWPLFPGHRPPLVLIPFPAAAALGILGVAATASRRLSAFHTPAGRVIGTTLAAVLVSAGLAAAVWPGLAELRHRDDRPPDSPLEGGAARLVASYLTSARTRGPVVIFYEPSGGFSAFSWEGRQDQARTFAPEDLVRRVFVVVGELGDDGLPERSLPVSGRKGPIFAYTLARSWAAGGPALEEGAVVLAPRDYFGVAGWRSVTRDPSRIVAPGLAVLRGPHVVPARPVGPARIPRIEAAIKALEGLGILAVLGGGYSAAAIWQRRGALADVLALAPAFGVIAAILTGTIVALAGSDPSGVAGYSVAVLVAAAGYRLAWNRHGRLRPAARLGLEDVGSLLATHTG